MCLTAAFRSTSRCAVVGFGYWGPNWARTIAEVPGFQLTAVVDANEARVEKAANLYPSTVCSRDLAILEHLEVDFVVVATPPSSHLDIVRSLGQLGVRLVVVEKPLAISSSEVLTIYATAEAYGMKIAVDYPYLYSDAVRQLREILSRSGSFDYVESQRHNLGIFRPDMDVLWDLSVHDLSIFDYLFGPLVDVSVSCSTTNSLGSNHPSSGLIQVQAPQLPRLVSSVSWISPAKVRRMVAHSPEKMIIWDDTSSMDPLKIYETSLDSSETDLLQYRIGNSYSPQVNQDQPLAVLLREILEEQSFDFVADKERTIRVSHVLELAAISNKSESRFLSSPELRSM